MKIKLCILLFVLGKLTFAGAGGIAGGSGDGGTKPEKGMLGPNSSWERILKSERNKKIEVQSNTYFMGAGLRSGFDICLENDQLRTKETLDLTRYNQPSRGILYEQAGYLYYPLVADTTKTVCRGNDNKNCRRVPAKRVQKVEKYLKVHQINRWGKVSPRAWFKKKFRVEDCRNID